ncbi:MAG: ThuA domain-containing protein [Phycisphaerales bacterium]|nr:ThuA domain-containing protein [Phycisphaerales bacterium]
MTASSPPPLRVTVWHEYRHEKKSEAVRKLYPDGMHAVIASAIKEHLGDNVVVKTATLDEPEHGLADDVLNNTDVMTWWGHNAHREVNDAIVDKVCKRVREGMGILFLHSAHYSKPFHKLMGTGCGLKWREAAELERLWIVNPAHEIADGLGEYFEIPHDEMYGELFDIPTPDELVMIAWFEGGNVFRSCCTWTRGKGKVVYFQPGHETFPVYYQPEVRRVIANAVRWAAPRSSSPFTLGAPNAKVPLSPIASTHVVDESLHKPA